MAMENEKENCMNVTVRLTVQQRDLLRNLAARRTIAGRYSTVCGLLRECALAQLEKEAK